MRLIDADARKQQIESPYTEYPIIIQIRKALKDFIDDAPTIDAEPIKHGHWINTGSGEECSVCREIQYGYDSFRNYCAYCGAKMDEVSEDNILRKDTLDEVRKDLLKLNMLANDNLAHWIVEESEHGFGKVAICSNCKMDFWEWMSKFDYCPNCGVKMERSKE